MGNQEWENFVRGMGEAGVDSELMAGAYIAEHILGVYYEEAERALDYLETPNELQTQAREILIRRWRQIKSLVEEAVEHNASL